MISFASKNGNNFSGGNETSKLPATASDIQVANDSITINEDGYYSIELRCEIDAKNCSSTGGGYHMTVNDTEVTDTLAFVQSSNYSIVTLSVMQELKVGDVLKFVQNGASMGCILGSMRVIIQKYYFE